MITEFTPQQLNAAKNYLDERKKGKWKGVAKWDSATLNERNEGLSFDEKSWACHADLGVLFRRIVLTHGYDSKQWPRDAKPFLALIQHNPSQFPQNMTQEAADAFVMWLVSDDNPLGKYILNREDEALLKSAGIIIHCGPGGANHTEALWLCKVLRYGVEGQQAINRWYEMYKAGVDPLLAIALCIKVSQHTLSGSNVFEPSDGNSHCDVFRGSSLHLDAIINRKINPFTPETCWLYQDSGRRIIHMEYNTAFRKFSKVIKKNDGWGNISTYSGLTVETMVEAAVSLQEKWAKECKVVINQKPVFGPPVKKVVEEKTEKDIQSNTEFLDFDV